MLSKIDRWKFKTFAKNLFEFEKWQVESTRQDVEKLRTAIKNFTGHKLFFLPRQNTQKSFLKNAVQVCILYKKIFPNF